MPASAAQSTGVRVKGKGVRHVMGDKTVLVLAATGKTGRRVVDLLERRSVTVRAASRSAGHPFDWNNRATWKPALEGVDAAYVVDRQDQSGHWEAEVHIPAFVDLAVSLGVRRLVVLQARVYEQAGDKLLIAGERAVRECGVEWTILRPNWFAQNFDEGVLLKDVLAGELWLPAGGAVEPWVDAGDIAAVAVEALLNDGHAAQIYEVSGNRALGFADVAEEISRATGREIRYIPNTREEHIARLLSRGVPIDYATFVCGLIGQMRLGRNATVTDTVERVTGRPPRDFSDFAKAAAARGVWDA